MSYSTGFGIGPARFRNRVFLASGPAGYGLEYSDLIDLKRIGAVVTKTITFAPSSGNRGRRLWETHAGLLNSIGLENVGAERFFAEKLPELLRLRVRVVVSLAAEAFRDYKALLRAASKSDSVDAVEINLSCPNVDCGGMTVGSDPKLVEKYIRAARVALPKVAVIAKLTPNTSKIIDLARAAERGGAHAITAINTLVAMELFPETHAPVFERLQAGLSGPAIFPVALEAVWRISRSVSIPVVASGGISSLEDAEKMISAGAAAVQIGTAIFFDPLLPERIVDAFEKGSIKPSKHGCRTSERFKALLSRSERPSTKLWRSEKREGST